MEEIQTKNRKVGRPKLSADERRSFQIKIGFTPGQYEALSERAESAGLSDVELIRRLAVNQQFYSVPSVNRTALIELNKIGVNLNQLTKLANSQPNGLLIESLDHIKADIKAIAKVITE